MSRFWTLYVLVVCLRCSAHGQAADDLVRLFDDKILKSNPYIRPVLNQSDCLNISLHLNIIAITDFNEVLEKLSFTAWLNVVWYDQTLTWTPNQYGGAAALYAPIERIWHPNLAVANTMSSFNPRMESTDMVFVHSDGKVEWYPGVTFHVYCEVDTTMFPFDAQECLVEILVWDYGLRLVDMHPLDNTMGTTMFRSNGEWAIVSTSVYREMRYPGRDPKPAVVAKIKVKRRPQFVLVNIILPTALLTVLNCFVFLIPVDSGEKISFAVTILLAYGVLMSYITDMLPKTSKTTSSLSIYMVSSLIFSSCFVAMAIVITRLYKKSEAETPVPVFLAKATRRFELILCRRGSSKLKCESCDNHSVVDKMAGKPSPVSTNGSRNPRYYSNAETQQAMTWKRVSKCLDLTMFLLFFPVIIVASVVIMLEDNISIKDS